MLQHATCDSTLYLTCAFLLLLQLLHVPPTDENIGDGSLGSYHITAVSNNDWSIEGCIHCIAETGRSFVMLHIQRESCLQKYVCLCCRNCRWVSLIRQPSQMNLPAEF